MRSRQVHNRRRMFAAAISLIAILIGCARPESGVSVKSLAADLVFGIPPLPEEVTPPNTSTTPAEPLGVIGTTDSKPRPRQVVVPSEECEEADVTEFPDEEATTTIDRRPQAGEYRWVVVGTQDVTGLGVQDLANRKYSRRIQNIVNNPTTNSFTFETVEDEVVFGSTTKVTSRWEVRPEDGVFLVRIVHEIPGRPAATFAPNPPVLYLSTPVRLGDDITAVGVDPVSQEALEHSGEVTKRQHVDACGELVDSWFVNGQQRFTSARGRSYQRDYDYSIATQFGGIIVFEHVETSDKKLKFDARLGQVSSG